MNPNLEQLKNLKTITLTSAERDRIRAHVAYLMTTRPQPVQSWFQRGIHHGLRIALSSFVFFIFVGGMCSAVANNALPGDPLYAFKLNINEKVKGFFQQTPEAKVAYNAKRVETRVKEIKTLAESKTLTKAKQATVQKALDEHIQDLSADLGSVPASAALSVTANLENTLQANKALIESTDTTDTSAKEVALQTVDGTLQKVSNQEVKILSKEIDAIATDVSASSASATIISPDTPFGP